MSPTERSATDWYHEAVRSYLEHHQGCAWCGGSHRVYRIRGETTVEYYCNACDFRVGHDERTGKCFSMPGEKKRGRVRSTMHQKA